MNTNHDYRLGGMFIALSNIIVYVSTLANIMHLK